MILKMFLELIPKSLSLFYDLDLLGFVIIMLTEKIQIIMTVTEDLKDHPRD